VQFTNYPDLHQFITFKVHIRSAEVIEVEEEVLEFNHKLVLLVLGITIMLFMTVILMVGLKICGAPVKEEKFKEVSQ
jgi:hypothetical protein